MIVALYFQSSKKMNRLQNSPYFFVVQERGSGQTKVLGRGRSEGLNKECDWGETGKFFFSFASHACSRKNLTRAP